MATRALDPVSVWERTVGWGRSMAALGLLRRIRGTLHRHELKRVAEPKAEGGRLIRREIMIS